MGPAKTFAPASAEVRIRSFRCWRAVARSAAFSLTGLTPFRKAEATVASSPLASRSQRTVAAWKPSRRNSGNSIPSKPACLIRGRRSRTDWSYCPDQIIVFTPNFIQRDYTGLRVGIEKPAENRGPGGEQAHGALPDELAAIELKHGGRHQTGAASEARVLAIVEREVAFRERFGQEFRLAEAEADTFARDGVDGAGSVADERDVAAGDGAQANGSGDRAALAGGFGT